MQYGLVRAFQTWNIFRKMCDEFGSVTPDMTADWLLSKLPSLLDEFRPEDIFNANEMGLSGNACRTNR